MPPPKHILHPLADLTVRLTRRPVGGCPCSEWAVNQHRDSLALYVGFDPLAQYIAIAENEAIGRVKFNSLQVRTHAHEALSLARSGPDFAELCTALSNSHCHTLRPCVIQKMIQPCGPPPPKEED